MRLMTKEELVAVSGGEGKIYDPFNEDSDWDFVSWANDMGLFDLEFGDGVTRGKKTTKTIGDAEKIAEKIQESLPAGSAKCVIDVVGDANGVTSWHLTCTFTGTAGKGKK